MKGLIFGAGLIIAIGAQNAYVLRQGLAQRYVFIIAFVSSVADILLIVLGVGGLGAIIAQNETLTLIATWGGALFLLFFALRSFSTARNYHGIILTNDPDIDDTAKSAAMAALGFSLLNPHVYLDTVVLIGSLGAQFPPHLRWWFAGGACLASILWFFGLAYGARWLSPLFQKSWAAKALDIGIGIIMLWVALSLVWQPHLNL
ncbi:MAG: LysE/ArgO family amino acid transporter [Chloroflexota bacterium]